MVGSMHSEELPDEHDVASFLMSARVIHLKTAMDTDQIYDFLTRDGPHITAQLRFVLSDEGGAIGAVANEQKLLRCFRTLNRPFEFVVNARRATLFRVQRHLSFLSIKLEVSLLGDKPAGCVQRGVFFGRRELLDERGKLFARMLPTQAGYTVQGERGRALAAVTVTRSGGLIVRKDVSYEVAFAANAGTVNRRCVILAAVLELAHDEAW